MEAATNTTDTGETPEGRKADIVTATASWKLEAGSWKLEAGSWKLEAGSWKSFGSAVSPVKR
ncbi:MAG TPA: hypothetical protein DHV63_03840 [Pseudomonas sp.]|nr:hypothetical protein [Pseudomonas sp.]